MSRRKPPPAPRLAHCQHCEEDTPPLRARTRISARVIWICRACRGPRT